MGLDGWLVDVRIAWRRLRRAPGRAAASVAVLALGIGASVGLFAVYHAVFVRPLPYGEPERLVSLQALYRSTLGEDEWYSASPLDVARWRHEARSFESVSGLWSREFGVAGDGEPASVPGDAVSASLFETLRVRPVLGRAFTEDEERQGAPVVVLGHALWQRRFGGEPDVLGRSLRLDGVPHTIVGVMGPEFVTLFQRSELWVPLSPEQWRDAPRWTRHFLDAIGRLRPGVSRAAAAAELRAIRDRLEVERPDTYRGWGVGLRELREQFMGERRPALLLLLAGVGVLLLMACGNLAHVTLAVAVARRGDAAIQRALGAPTARLVRAQAVESLLVASAGAGLGTALAFAGLRPVLSLDPELSRLAGDVGIEPAVLVFSAAAALVSALLSGLLPVVRGSSRATVDLPGSRAATPGREERGARRALVAAETALGLVLLAGGSALLSGVSEAARQPPGFEPRGLLVSQVVLPANRYATPETRVAFVDRLLERLREIPGVEAASTTMTRFAGPLWTVHSTFRLEEDAHAADSAPNAHLRRISPGYVEAMGTRLLAGRQFETTDTAGRPGVVLVSESLARRYWPGQEAVGRQLRVPAHGDAPSTVVGVLPDVRDAGLSFDLGPTLYVPWAQNNAAGPSWEPVTLLIRAAADPLALAPSVRRAVAGLDPDLPMEPPRSATEVLSDTLGPERFQAGLLGAFAAAGLLLAAAGLQATTAYGVARRRRELGVRLALGAAPRDVVVLLVREALAPVAVGLAVGSLGVWLLEGTLTAAVPGLASAGPGALAGAAVLLAAVAALAAWWPARHAARLDPMTTLREESA